jgi:hydrogenase large subunit
MAAKDEKAGIVEMARDPITRVIGSLGIYTKVDFGQSKVIECHSTSSIFRGYSVLPQETRLYSWLRATRR